MRIGGNGLRKRGPGSTAGISVNYNLTSISMSLQFTTTQSSKPRMHFMHFFADKNALLCHLKAYRLLNHDAETYARLTIQPPSNHYEYSSYPVFCPGWSGHITERPLWHLLIRFASELWTCEWWQLWQPTECEVCFSAKVSVWPYASVYVELKGILCI